MAEASVRRTKEEVLQGLNNEIICKYQEVILLAALYNQARDESEIEDCHLNPSVHLLVKSFANVLGSSFKSCTGNLIAVTRDTTSLHGSSARIIFDSTKAVVPVKTWQVDHAWLEVPSLDIWVDVMTPGSYVWLSPVLYMPGKYRPPYTKQSTVIDSKNETRLSDINEFGEVLKKLLQEKGPNC